MNSSSRFASAKYSRTERRKRALGRHVSGQSKITAYFDFLNKVEVTLRSNEEVISALSARCKELSACVSDFSSQNNNLSTLLQLLLNTAQKNSQREGSHGNRYENDLKYFAVYVFIIGGRFIYEFLYENLKPALPSLSQVERTLASTSAPVKEGKFRFSELSKFLDDNNLPRRVFISEDGTRIVQKFLYDLTSDQIIGPTPPLAENGVPITSSFPATSAALIATHFEKYHPASSAYAIMAQPVKDGAPAFCLCIFGTDNRFTAEQVYKRWLYIFEELSKIDIICDGFSSDGDPKLLAAMHFHLFQGGATEFEEFKDFYFASKGQFHVMQDYIHTANKFRHRLSPSIYLPIGNVVASQTHLKMLMDRPKEEHALAPSDLDKDKMYFNASIKICSKKVTTLMKEHVPGSDGTVAYLDVMRKVMECGLNQSLSPLEKIYNIWYAVFFFRYWKHWLSKNPKFTLDNFVSRNLYICVEIIAHTLISWIVKCRDENQPEFLLIHLFSSQACEALFRLARSLTSAECTVINFAMKELLQKIRRLDMLLHVIHQLDGKLVFPREKRKKLLGILSEETMKSSYLPNNDEIRSCVLQAKSDAISTLRGLGVSCPNSSSMGKIKASLLSYQSFDIDKNVDVDATYESTIDEDDIPLDLMVTFPSPEDVVALDPHGHLGEDTFVPIKSSHVAVPDDKGGFKTISKTLLCWMFSSAGSPCLNNIRIHRVREKALTSVGNPRSIRGQSVPVTSAEDEITLGNWCIFKSKSKYVFIQILGFKYLTGKCLSYTLPKAPVKPPKGKVARGIECLGIWFNLNYGNLTRCSSQHNTINIDNYVATMPPPSLDKTGKLLLCTETVTYLEGLGCHVNT